MRIVLLLTAAVLLSGASWIDPHATAREAARLYENGDFAAATQKYNEALTDDPDSPLLQYNRGVSLYREKKFEDAATALLRATTVDPEEIAYNVGNAKYQLGLAAAESDPQTALGLYTEALAAYRRAMGADPDDIDAKFNHELVTKRLEELKRKLEEQKQQQEQQQQSQQDQQSPDQKQQDPQQQGQQEQADNAEQPQEQASQQESPERQQEQSDQAEQKAGQDEQQGQEAPAGDRQEAGGESGDGEPQQRTAATENGERSEGEMSEHEARALLDAARDQEVRPEEIIERMQGGTVLEPSQDW